MNLTRLIDNLPKQARVLVGILVSAIITLFSTLMFITREDRSDCKTEIKEWKDKCEIYRKETAECQVDMIVHLRQDWVQDSIDAVYNRQKIEMMQNKIDTLKNLFK